VADQVPTWWELLLASLAVYRLWRLLAEDEILERPRRRVLRYVGWEEGQALPEGYRASWGDLLRCPWCLGLHLSILAWIFWLFAPSLALIIATPFAVSTLIGLIRTNLDPPED
jgi:Protein of unknown function (DUF1360)